MTLVSPGFLVLSQTGFHLGMWVLFSKWASTGCLSGPHYHARLGAGMAEGGLSPKTVKVAGYGFTWELVEAMEFLPMNLFVDSPDCNRLNV